MYLEWEVEEKTKAAIVRKSNEIWQSFRRTPDVCRKLVHSLPSRLQEVVEAGGGWTKY